MAEGWSGIRGNYRFAAKKFLTDNDTVAVVGYTKCLAKATGKSYETDFIHLVTLRIGVEPISVGDIANSPS